MVTYTSAFLAAANLLAVAQAAPAWPTCQVVVSVIYGEPVWVPSDPSSTSTWGSWDPKATSSSSSSSSVSWSTWDPKKTSTTTTTTTTDGWASWTSSSSAKASSTSTTWSGPVWTTTTSSSSTWTTPSTTWSSTTTAPTTTTTTTTTKTTTTTTTTQPAATCAPSSYDFNTKPSAGSCGCEFSVECNMHASYGASTKFWEQTSGQLIDTLEQCIELCNNNSACQATVWSAQDPTDTQDYKRCWQISGLGSTVGTGFGQISRKGQCSGSCSASYSS